MEGGEGHCSCIIQQKCKKQGIWFPDTTIKSARQDWLQMALGLKGLGLIHFTIRIALVIKQNGRG